ncbi:MAG: adenosylmethionine--8-amino-7-oxononanoate transaminase [Pseudomonadota bacterium]
MKLENHHIWLPYAQMQTAPEPLPVTSTSGCKIKLSDSRELIDGISSWWSACHGYNHPHIVQAMEKQLQLMPHIMFAGLTHEPATTLASRLCAITPDGLNKVFFADSGSVAVEIALKIALQYWRNVGKPLKDRFICFKNGYHGDTLGAMSVSDPEKSLHKAFRNSVIKQYVLDIPSDEYSFAEFDSLLAGVQGNIAGIILEPLVQGAGGMLFHSADTVSEIYRIAKKHNILFIADEIATGFARTGFMFACDEAGISPDIMCIGKALTGGAITLGATLTTDEIFNAFLSDNPEDAFMHGPTFMANPLACSAANASLDLFENEPRLSQVEKIETQLAAELAPCKNLSGVVDVRVKGAIGVVQVDTAKIDIYALRPEFVKRGVWLRPFKDVIYTMPPLTISSNELSSITNAIKDVLNT